MNYIQYLQPGVTTQHSDATSVHVPTARAVQHPLLTDPQYLAWAEKQEDPTVEKYLKFLEETDSYGGDLNNADLPTSAHKHSRLYLEQFAKELAELKQKTNTAMGTAGMLGGFVLGGMTVPMWTAVAGAGLGTGDYFDVMNLGSSDWNPGWKRTTKAYNDLKSGEVVDPTVFAGSVARDVLDVSSVGIPVWNAAKPYAIGLYNTTNYSSLGNRLAHPIESLRFAKINTKLSDLVRQAYPKETAKFMLEEASPLFKTVRYYNKGNSGPLYIGGTDVPLLIEGLRNTPTTTVKMWDRAHEYGHLFDDALRRLDVGMARGNFGLSKEGISLVPKNYTYSPGVGINTSRGQMEFMADNIASSLYPEPKHVGMLNGEVAPYLERLALVAQVPFSSMYVLNGSTHVPYFLPEYKNFGRFIPISAQQMSLGKAGNPKLATNTKRPVTASRSKLTDGELMGIPKMDRNQPTPTRRMLGIGRYDELAGKGIFGKFIGDGSESAVYQHAHDPNRVLKVNIDINGHVNKGRSAATKMYVDQRNSFEMLEPIQLEGVILDNGLYRPVYSQKKVNPLGEIFEDEPVWIDYEKNTIAPLLEKLGFKRVSGGIYRNETDGVRYTISDIYPTNIGLDEHGKLIFFDVHISRKNLLTGREFDHGGKLNYLNLFK